MPGGGARIEDCVLLAFKLENGRVTRMDVLGFGQAEVQTALEAAGPWAQALVDVCDCKVTRCDACWEGERAVADRGISEDAMAQENVERMRAAFAAWNGGPGERDFARFRPGNVYPPRADEPGPGPLVGLDS